MIYNKNFDQDFISSYSSRPGRIGFVNMHFVATKIITFKPGEDQIRNRLMNWLSYTTNLFISVFQIHNLLIPITYDKNIVV